MKPIYLITLKQCLRQSHLWYINFMGLAASLFSPAFAELFTFGKAELAAVDILQASLYMTILFSLLTASYVLFARELAGRVFMMLFSKPIDYYTVIFAKFLAMATVILMMTIIQGTWVYFQGMILGWDEYSRSMVIKCLYSVFLQGIILLSLSISLSIIFSPLTGLLSTIFLSFLGYLLPGKWLLLFSFAIPALPWFNMTPVIYTHSELPYQYLLMLTLYTVAFSQLFLVMASLRLKYKSY